MTRVVSSKQNTLVSIKVFKQVFGHPIKTKKEYLPIFHWTEIFCFTLNWTIIWTFKTIIIQFNHPPFLFIFFPCNNLFLPFYSSHSTNWFETLINLFICYYLYYRCCFLLRIVNHRVARKLTMSC